MRKYDGLILITVMAFVVGTVTFMLTNYYWSAKILAAEQSAVAELSRVYAIQGDIEHRIDAARHVRVAAVNILWAAHYIGGQPAPNEVIDGADADGDGVTLVWYETDREVLIGPDNGRIMVRLYKSGHTTTAWFPDAGQAVKYAWPK